MMDEGQTQVVTFARAMDSAPDARLHCLELIDGIDPGRRYIIGLQGASIGRVAPADIVFADFEVSRAHCRFVLVDNSLTVIDLNSTNGTFVDGIRIKQPTLVPVGAVLRVGRQTLKHEWRTEREIQQKDDFDREIKRASSYVQALLPMPVVEGAVKTDWLFEPCAQLGGDAFGYGPLSDKQYLIYMVDVSGHGPAAAMHSVTIMNLLRQKALPRADMGQPDQVLAAINAMFPMEDHAGMYFTMWYGVYQPESRLLNFASAGHHPGFLVAPGSTEATPLRTRNGSIGVDSRTSYRSDTVHVPPGARLYLFSDGVFEIVTVDGLEWRLGDFVPYIVEPSMPGMNESYRLYRQVRRLARPGGLDDDFSLLVASFA
jgi:serine phosphatase RsbU (regulator of sigma subunit)